MDEPLPQCEAALLTVLLQLPYQKRLGYALRLVNNHRSDPALLSLIQELLSTTLLPDRVPFPGTEEDDGCITLLFPQSTASKRFFQRELGLAMASALGRPAIPLLLDAIIHPSTAGKSRAIAACVAISSGATDSQLAEVYAKSVPATQESLHDGMKAAGRVEALKLLQLWKEPPPVKIREPRCVVLEGDLKSSKLQDRDAVWGCAGLSFFKIHRHLHDSEYVHKDSEADLTTTLFGLLELYPPPHLGHGFKLPQDVPAIPSDLDKRMYSFLVCDLSRTLRLLKRTCHIPDPERKGRDMLKLPSSFMHHKSSTRFWHNLPLDSQKAHILPFILEVMQMQNQVLLKNGQLQAADLLQHVRWQIVISVTQSALASLESTQVVQALLAWERKGIIAFIVHAIDTLSSRLRCIAHREDALSSQTAIEHGLSDVLRSAVEYILVASRVSAMSDEAFVKDFTDNFVLPLLKGPMSKYPPLVEVLFDSIKGIFDIAQVTKSELVSTAGHFLRVLKRKKPSVFDIPEGRVVQPYCGIRNIDNAPVFDLLLRLEPPRNKPSLYANYYLDMLSEQQREVIWTYFNDLDYVCKQLVDDGGLKDQLVFIKILTELPNSPRARLPIVKALLDHPKIDDHSVTQLYPLLDISDPPSRDVLHKNTYKRLFTDRLVAYQDLMTATWAQDSPKAYIATMKFLIPRIKNEILPDAGQIPDILYKNGVGDVLHLLTRATDEEVKEVAKLYLAWEKQNNEAVSQVRLISEYILGLAHSALTYFSGTPDHPAFQFGMDLLWAREVFNKGPLNAYKTYDIKIYMAEPKLTEDEEFKRRQFILASRDALGKTGYWRISDVRQFVEILLKQYRKVQPTLPFENSAAYPGFISSMLELFGTRWTVIPALCVYTERQLDVLRRIAGSNDRPADWTTTAQREAIQYISRLRALYDDAKVTPEALPWWYEFRHLRLFSTAAREEVDLLYRETFDSEGKQNQEQLNTLVEKLLGIGDSVVYIAFVRSHLMEHRQDLLKDSHITSARVGLFNQLSTDAVSKPPEWEFTFPRRFYPRQCEVFAAKLLEIIHSGEVPLQSQVKAAEQLTKLPTTTIIELAKLLKQDLNQRIIEAILMFLPHLDEPASGIQYLLAPTYLDSDLARTVAFSVRNSLRHVPTESLPKILISIFPPENSKRVLKVTVMKELVRLLCQHASHEEIQTFLLALWRRKLHQDVRIAFLQSLISFLGTKQENLCWTVLRDAVSNPIYVLDSALFALLAVHPANPWVIPLSDVQVAYIADPDILTEMAQSPIPHQCHESYAKDVLYSISQLPFVVSVSSLGLSEREARKVRERLSQLQHSAYRAIFSCFLTASNAYAFAQRGLDGAKSVALSDEQGVDLFPYFVYGIGVCVALDPRCWEVLCQLVDFLAELVDNPRREPTKASLKAIQRLNAMQLRSNMVFQSPNSVREQLTVDRMSLLEPITRRGCDHFTVTFWERRFRLFTFERRRVSSESPTEVFPSELAEARSLLLELIHLYGSLQYDLAQFKSKITSLFDTASAPVADILTKDSLSGSHGLDGVWINELRLQVLSWRVHKTLDYARSLAAFQTQVSTYHNSFYAQHWGKINKLLVSALTADSAQNTTQEGLAAILLDPMFDRVPSSPLDLHILDRLLDKLPDVVIRHRPQWVIERTYTMLSALQPLDVSSSTPRLALLAALRPALLLVEYVNTVSTQEDSAAQTKLSAFSPLAALLIEAIYAGNMRNFNLARSTRSSAQRPEPVLMYPYFVTSQHDESGGDIESRGSKAIVPQLLDRYEQWKTTHASQYLSDVHQPQILPSALAIIQEVLASSPKLVLVHPSLFLSFAVVTFGEPYIETSTKIDKVVHHLKSVLKPNRERESGTRWGWAPPLSLTLSFARVLFTETANEVAEAIMDDYADIGSQTCKLAALELLEWWTKTFYGESLSEDLAQLVKSMEKGEGKEGLMREYDELRVLACRDESKVAREKAFVLPPSASLCEKR